MSRTTSKQTYTVSPRAIFDRGATTFDMGTKPAIQPLTRGIDFLKTIGQTAVLVMTTATTPCAAAERRFIFPESRPNTVNFLATLPVRRRISLGDARRRALETMEIVELHRSRIRDEEARRWELLDMVL